MDSPWFVRYIYMWDIDFSDTDLDLLDTDTPSKHFVLKTCLEDVFSVTIFRLPRRLQDVLEDVKLLRWRRVEDVFKTCLQDVFKTCLQDVFSVTIFRLPRRFFKTSSSRRLCKTSSRCLGRRKIVTLKMFWRRLQDTSWRRLQDQQMFAGDSLEVDCYILLFSKVC